MRVRVIETLMVFLVCAVLFSTSSCGGSSAEDAGTADTGSPPDSGGPAPDAGGTPDAGGAPDAGYSKAAKLTRGPWLGNVTAEGITVRWETDREAQAAVEYAGASAGTVVGTTTAHMWKVGIDAKEVSRFQHSAALSGLEAGATFNFTIPDLREAAEGSFVTAPAQKKPFRFAVYGDSRAAAPYLEDHAEHRALAAAIAGESPEFYINTGDLVFAGAMDGEWYLFFDTSGPIMPLSPFYPVAGNHEEGGEKTWAALFDLPGDGEANLYYSFDYSNSHFIVLCSGCGLGAADPQIAWFSSDIAAAAQNAEVENVFVAFHEPAYTYSDHSADGDAQANVVPLLKQHGVRAVFSGHNHLYERIQMEGVTYLTLGGGGAPLYDLDEGEKPGLVKAEKVRHYAVFDVDGTAVHVKVKKEDGTEIEAFDL
ncbi:MAG: metallophosphoesterase [Deltaproteobacteria bacterium]|nr:metallophosphoesterase [Deltaproteobacteria bacterium]